MEKIRRNLLCHSVSYLYLCKAKYVEMMREFEIRTMVRVLQENELSSEDKKLISSAKEATNNSYSPYSHFKVGAALLLENNEIITGSNQENAAYPVGCCAERTALFWCKANRPGINIKAIAIAARQNEDFTLSPIAPCGMCRQALIEVEHIQKESIRVLLYGQNGTYCTESIACLLPLTFGADDLKG